MEETETELQLEEFLLKKPAKDKNDSVASSSGEKGCEEKKDVPEAPLEDDQTASGNQSSNRPVSPLRSNSPEPSCPICLEQLQNKSYTDGCKHMFCFTCLVEWSKVKAECPLCKQRFKTIVHNIRSRRDFDEYYIHSKSTESVWTVFRSGTQNFRCNTTTVTAERLLDRNSVGWVNPRTQQEIGNAYHQEMASHRMRYAPHSVRLYTTSHVVSRIPCSFRRRIYDEDLWVRPSSPLRIRMANPEFYRTNPACTHRLIPWLNRELVALLPNGDNHVTFVMELIMALINRYEITGQDFFLHVEPYLSDHTNHFIHEFYNFAVSPYDMENYDRQAVYGPFQSTLNRCIPTPDSDVIAIPNDNSLPESSSRRSHEESSHHQRKKRLRAFKRLQKLYLKRNKSNNSWESVMPPSGMPLLQSYDCVSGFFPAAGPSNSPLNKFNALLAAAAAAASFESNTSKSKDHTQGTSEEKRDESINNSYTVDDDECQVVDVLKPKRERTPEIVDLSSDEEMPPKLIDVSSGDEYFFPRHSPLNELEPMDLSVDYESSSDIECIYEKPCNKETSCEAETFTAPSTSYVTEDGACSAVKDTAPASSVIDDESEKSKQKRLPSVIAHPVYQWPPMSATDCDSSSHSWSNSTDLSRKRLNILTPACTSSECSSDSEHTVGKSSKQKLKLRSVIAHCSVSHNVTEHHSSHKKHKGKKKKKKKHTHKHKHRIYSDSD